MEIINFWTTKLKTPLHILKLKQVVNEVASCDRAHWGSRRAWGEREAGSIGSDLGFAAVISDQKTLITFLIAPSLLNNLEVSSLNIKRPWYLLMLSDTWNMPDGFILL